MVESGDSSDSAASAETVQFTVPMSPSTPTVPVPVDDEDRWMWPRARRQIAVAVCLLSGLVMLVLLGHRQIPDVRGIGSMIDTFLPWTLVPLLLAVPAALVSLSRWAIGLALLGVVVWGADSGPP